jgi:hypothetical protein
MDHKADKFSLRCDEGIDLFRELLKSPFKRATGSYEKNTPVSQQFKFDHGSIHPMSSGHVAAVSCAVVATARAG